MSESTWQFRKLQFSNRYPSTLTLRTLLLPIAWGLLGCSCTVQKSSEDSPSGVTQAFSQLLTPQNQNIEIFTTSADVQPGVVGSLNADACQNGVASASQIWTVPIALNSQKINATITFSEPSRQQPVTVEIDGRKIELAKAEVPPGALVSDFCRVWQENPTQRIATAEPQIQTAVLSWLRLFAPDCNFKETSPQGWVCSLTRANAGNAQATLGDMQARMIQKWSRHPYSLTRRLAVARNLADSIVEGLSESGFSRFCKILNTSLPEELPLAFAAPRWRDAVCAVGIDGTLRAKIAEAGLQMALAEQTFLHQLVEQTSLLGLLQVRIPNGSVSNHDFWITLAPMDEVAQSVLVTSAEISGGETPDKFGCWHPYYGGDMAKMELAARLQLLQPQTAAGCKSVGLDDKAALAAGQYMSNSILGETEFLVGNGNSKILRLPKGQYSYVIHGLPENARQWQPSDSDVTSTGQITWVEKRPHAVIATW
jgi:hypothetical protein